jgi:hypothetical protein
MQAKAKSARDWSPLALAPTDWIGRCSLENRFAPSASFIFRLFFRVTFCHFFYLSKQRAGGEAVRAETVRAS